MACQKKNSNKKRKRLPSINPFFHFLKKMWKKYRGRKKSSVVEMAAQRWQCMSRFEKEPFYRAACKAQRLHRKLKKEAQAKCQKKQKNGKTKTKKKPKKSQKKNGGQVCCPPCPPCP